MRISFFVLISLTLISFLAFEKGMVSDDSVQPLRVLVLTGGHGYDTLDFQRMFDELSELEVTYNLLEKNTAFFDDISGWKYDVLVFYNFRNKLTEKGKQNFMRLCERGVGLVFLHHSVMGFDNWPAFREIVGAKYFFEGEAPPEKLGTYRHDVTMNIHIEDSQHPITKGLEDFQLYDEVYGNYWISEDNHLLLTTDHPDSQPEIGWTRRYKKSDVAFIQPGHGKEALRDERYAALVRRAILWAGGRL